MNAGTRWVLCVASGAVALVLLADERPGWGIGLLLLSAYFFATARQQTKSEAAGDAELLRMVNAVQTLAPNSGNRALDAVIKEDREKYCGPLSRPPCDEARATLSALTEEERANFYVLLARLQAWHESNAGNQQVLFHADARVSLWGLALAKIADHYREIEKRERGLFFMSAAWTLSKYPVFAYNAGLLSLETGNLAQAKSLLRTFLAEYRNALSRPALRLINPDLTEHELEDMAKTARTKLAEDLPPSEAPPRPTAPIFSKDGVTLQARGGFLGIQQQMFRLYMADLKGNDLTVASRWAEEVTGVPIKDGVWADEHEDALVRGLERFLWEGNPAIPALAELFGKLRPLYHQAYPVLEGSPIDVEMDDTIRSVFTRLLAQENARE